jgi:glycosyltransferase involved in cell wall biosynthesis
MGAAAIGHEVHVLAPDYHRGSIPEDGALPFVVERFHGDFCSVVSTDGIVRHTVRVHRAVRRFRADIVHAVDPPSQMALAMLARLGLVRRHFLTVHGTELLRYRREPFPRLWMWGAMRRATAVCAVSDAVRQLLVDSFPTRPDTVFASHPGIADCWFEAPPADRARVREAWGVSGDDVVMLTLARRVPEKGHLDVIDALALLPIETRSRIAYVVAGTGPSAYAQDLVRAAGRAAVRLHLPGALTDEQAIEAADAADLFVLLSRETPRRLEGLGLAFLEAAARSLPALARDTGGVREAVRHGESGILLPASATAADAAAQMRRLACEPELRSRLGAAAARYAAAFTLHRHAGEVYDRFLAA